MLVNKTQPLDWEIGSVAQMPARQARGPESECPHVPNNLGVVACVCHPDAAEVETKGLWLFAGLLASLEESVDSMFSERPSHPEFSGNYSVSETQTSKNN